MAAIRASWLLRWIWGAELCHSVSLGPTAARISEVGIKLGAVEGCGWLDEGALANLATDTCSKVGGGGACSGAGGGV